MVGWAMKGGSIMKTGRIIAVLAVSLLAVLVLVLLWIGRGGREPEGTVVSVTEKQAMTFAEGEIRRIAGEGGRTAHGTIPRRSSKADPFTAPTTGATDMCAG